MPRNKGDRTSLSKIDDMQQMYASTHGKSQYDPNRQGFVQVELNQEWRRGQVSLLGIVVYNQWIVVHNQFFKEDTDQCIGEPGFAEGMIPIWGNGRSAIHAARNGRYGSAVLYGAAAAFDVFLITKLVTLAKGILKGSLALKVAPTAGSAAGTFNEAGIMARGGERIVLPQGPNPTCGPICAAMVAEGEGAWVISENYVVAARQAGYLTDRGVLLSDLPKLLSSEARVTSQFVPSATLEQLGTATAKGKPAIVRLNPANVGEGGHAIIVDGVTNRMGKPVVAIRNPHGQKYYQLVSEFEKQWDKSMVVVEGIK